MVVDIKLFDIWNVLKKKIHQRIDVRYFREGQIWWCYIGQNVGSETYGKGDKFIRPVLIFRKLSPNLFLGIPITSKDRSGSWYSLLTSKSTKQVAMLYQARVMDRKRLSNRMMEISEKEMERLEVDLISLWSRGKYSPRLTAGIKGLPLK